MADYDDGNRAFLQAFIGRSSMTFQDAQPVLAAILSVSEGQTVDPSDIDQEQFYSYLEAANKAISQFDLEIRSSIPQNPQSTESDTTPTIPARVWALVNTTSDPLTQLATTYTADEIAFLKRLLDFMFLTNNTVRSEGMCAKQLQAVGLHKAPTGGRQSTSNDPSQPQSAASQSLTMTQAEKVIVNLIAEGWLQKSQKGYLTLTPRALMELRGWLVAEYNDDNVTRIKKCAACKEPITVGQRCAVLECKGRLHDHCMANFFRMKQSETCPVCDEEWPGNFFVGERALTATSRPSGVAPRRTPVPIRSSEGASTQASPAPPTPLDANLENSEADSGEEE